MIDTPKSNLDRHPLPSQTSLESIIRKALGPLVVAALVNTPLPAIAQTRPSNSSTSSSVSRSVDHHLAEQHHPLVGHLQHSPRQRHQLPHRSPHPGGARHSVMHRHTENQGVHGDVGIGLDAATFRLPVTGHFEVHPGIVHVFGHLTLNTARRGSGPQLFTSVGATIGVGIGEFQPRLHLTTGITAGAFWTHVSIAALGEITWRTDVSDPTENGTRIQVGARVCWLIHGNHTAEVCVTPQLVIDPKDPVRIEAIEAVLGYTRHL